MFKRELSDSVRVTGSLSTSLIPGVQDRNWAVRWQQLETRIKRLRTTRFDGRNAAAIHSATQDLFEFLVSAYHLKDALKNDGVVSDSDAEKTVRSNPTLALLADLANMDKHRRLDPKRYTPKSGGVPVVGRLSDRSEGLGWQVVVPIHSNGQVFDGLTFANQVMDEWRSYLTKQGLIGGTI